MKVPALAVAPRTSVMAVRIFAPMHTWSRLSTSRVGPAMSWARAEGLL